ncbi:unnamed protein product [Urochloa humidicola]
MEATDTVPAPALPYDVVEDILRRLPARSLAASQCVCKAWRDIVNDLRLLLRLRPLLPHSVRGLFVNYLDHSRPHFLARPVPAPPADGDGGPRVNGKFSFIPRENSYVWHNILDHCNGLVLDRGDDAMYVCNPTTRQWARLPPHPNQHWHRHLQHRTFLVFDPAISLPPTQWQVLVAPLEPHKEKAAKDMEPEERMMEWPPAMWRWSVLSSTAMEWEEKVFVRHGEAAGTVGDLLMHDLDDKYVPRWRNGAYCHGALYVHCRGEFISRLSLSTTKYQVIKSPIDLAESQVDEGAWLMSYIGRSRNRVCFAALDSRQLRVWILNESDDKTEWLLMHCSVVNLRCENTRGDGPWTFDAYDKYGCDIQSEDDEEVSQEDSETEDDEIVSSQKDREIEDDGDVLQEDSKTGDDEEISQQDRDTSETEDDEEVSHEDSETEDDEAVSEEDNRDWNSDDDSITDIEEEDNCYFQSNADFLGFHPYREVIFLRSPGNSAVAYHLNSKKAQYLGDLHLGGYSRGLFDSFVYTPCLIGV